MLCKHCIAILLSADMTDDGIWASKKSLIISVCHKLQFISKTITKHPQIWNALPPTSCCTLSFLYCLSHHTYIPGRRINGGGKAGGVILLFSRWAFLCLCLFHCLCLCHPEHSHQLIESDSRIVLCADPPLNIQCQEEQGRRQGWRDRLFGSYSDVCLIEVGCFFCLFLVIFLHFCLCFSCFFPLAFGLKCFRLLPQEPFTL